MVYIVDFLMVSVVAGKRLIMVSVAGFLVDSAAARGFQISEHFERFLVCCVFRTCFRRWLFNGFHYAFVWFPLRFLMVAVTLFMVSVAGLFVDSAAAGGSKILERLERFLVLVLCF